MCFVKNSDLGPLLRKLLHSPNPNKNLEKLMMNQLVCFNNCFPITYCSERNNYRLTAPLQMELNGINKIRKMKQLSWTEVADFLEKFSEFERGSEGKMCVG